MCIRDRDVIATSKLSNRPVVPDEVTPEECERAADKILVVPAVEENEARRSNKRDGRAKCITLVEEDATERPRGKISLLLYFVRVFCLGILQLGTHSL